MKHIDISRERTKRRIPRRFMGILLAAAVTASVMPVGGFAVSGSAERTTELCAHHPEHTAECGYSVEDNTPCGYECRICPIEDLIAALPEQVTEDNAADVRAQLEEILALYGELNEDEQGQIDLSRCYELQEALDNANAPNTIEGEVSVNYQEAAWSGNEVTYTTKTADSCTPVTDSTTAWTDGGWYVVNSTVTISEPITVTGAVNLLLADGCTLNAEKGIVVTTGNSLTIYAQSGGTGTLTVTGTTDSDHNASAGIGGSIASVDSGTITIHGGVINATGGGQSGYYGAAGIGGGTSRSGNGGNSSTIIIYGNTVTANSGEGDLTGAGIGGGSGGGGGTSNNITIYGGSVTASSTGTGTGGAGIGGGGGLTGGGAGNNIQIYGGTINATGSNRGAGIGGGGSSGTSGDGTVTISGGIVTAIGGRYAAGIGGGGGYSTQYGGCTGGTGSVTITGGIVDATGGAGNSSSDYAGAPIGNGGNTTATATVNKTTGIVFENGAGTVCGAVTLDGSYTVPAGYTLNIPAGASLSGSGTLSGGSAFTTENLTAGMISVPTDFYYTGEDRTADITTKLSGELTKGVAICGQTFTVGGWTLEVAKTDDLHYTATYTNNSDSTNTFTKTITLQKSGTDLTEGKVKTYNGETETTSFTAGDTIKVVAAPTPTGAAPQKAAARLRADPTEGQMVVYVGTTQVSVPADKGEDGIYTMEVSAADVLIYGQEENEKYTLTVKFVGNANMADAETPVAVTITRNPLTADMVTLSAECGTYSGTEQKPTVTVTGLTEGTDYEITYTGNFTSAGEHTLTVTGKGIYRGTVEKTYTIGKATPTIKWEPWEVTVTYTGQPADVKPVITLVNGEEYTGEIHYSWLGVADSLILPTDAGSYGGVRASIPEQDNYNTAITQITLTLRIDLAEQTAPAAPTADEENIKDTSITLDTIENAEYKRDDGEWQESPTFTGLEPNQTYTFYARLKEDRNHNASPNSEGASITTKKTMLENGFVTALGMYTYTGAAIVPPASEVAVMLNGERIASDQYTISANNNINAGVGGGTITATATENGDYSGSVSSTFTIAKATPTITWSDTSQELTFTGEKANIAAPTVTLVNNESFDGTISYSYKKQGETAYTNGLPVNAGTYTVKAHIDATGNYTAADSAELTLTIKKAQGTLTVPASPIEKTFGDKEFALNCTTNGDGKISYSSDNENVATVSADGTVLIKGAGEAEITVSLGEGENYTGAAAHKISITVAKAAAPQNISETRNYTYANGSKGEITVDVAGKLPKDRGETEYSVSTTDDNGILTGAAADENGNLVFTVSGGAVGNTASITVTAEMANYGDVTYTLNIKLVEKKVVEPKTAVTVKGSNILTYGETLSELAFNSVIFVEQGTETEVKGALSWKNPKTAPTVGSTSAEWVFTPEDSGEYAELTGTAAITVVKATPNVKAPTAENITYDPSKTLSGVGLSGGSAVWTVGGSSVTVEGAWSWKNTAAVPTVKNSGYTAVFTPSDTVNYNTAECTVAVTVAKAEPYIAVPPTAAQITYGDSLNASALSGGTVQYSNSDTTAVAGGFAWKDSTTKPVVSDSDRTEYALIFTPADTANYISVETTITLTVEKAENAPNMPSAVMNVKRSCEKVSDVELPQNWQWQDADKDTALEINVGVTATAVYVGTDKGNYKHETVTIAITRADCDHAHTELRNVKAATCKEKGYSGDTYCTDCGELLKNGNETDTIDHSGGVATCTHGKICDMCGTEYTEKNSANHTHIEIRGAKDATCTAEGYTGDTYCTDCETITETGTSIPTVPHDWQVTSEKPATTTAEGKRIYTCSMCKQTREETIPKLPQPSHKHSYSEKTTKEATCTESGEMILSCSCGDTIIRSIPALGHNYRSEVTKPATVTEAGVMTYTCTRCGHSYTETIKKLEDDPTKPDTRPETGKPFIKDENGKDGWSIIKEELGSAENGSTVTVDMNGAAVVPKTVFDTLRGRDVTAVFDMGGGITWSVNGKDVTSDKISDIDFSVKADTENIPVDVINNITGERYSIQISLAHNGEFGFTAVLSINLGSGNAGQKAALYYYNGGTLELMCESEISADGTARLTFTHASDYLIVIGEGKTDEGDNSGTTSSGDNNPSEADNSGTTSSGEVSDPSNSDKDDNDGNPSTGVAVSLIPLAAAAAFIIAAAKRKNK